MSKITRSLCYKIIFTTISLLLIGVIPISYSAGYFDFLKNIKSSGSGSNLVVNAQYRQYGGATAEFMSYCALYTGDYQAVTVLLANQPLSEQGLFTLNRARLALGMNIIRKASKGSAYGKAATGLMLANQGNLKVAEEVLLEAISDIIFDKSTLELNLAAVIYRQGRVAETEQIINSVARRDGILPALNIFLGDIALGRSEYKSALDYYALALATGYHKKDELLVAKQAVALIGLDQAIDQKLTEIRALQPSSGLPDYLEAQRVLRSGNRSAAKDLLLSAATKKLPDNLRAECLTLAKEISARLKAEAEIQAVIANPLS